jgi:transposase
MAPLVRRTLAPCGDTPVLKTQGRHREKVSITAALSLSPQWRHLGLYWQTYPRSYVKGDQMSVFLRQLLRHLRGEVIVVWDNASIHKGKPIRELCHTYPRLTLERMPPYAPELNPTEWLWNHLRYGQLANFLPQDVFELDNVLKDHLEQAKHSQERLQSFFEACDLPFW